MDQQIQYLPNCHSVCLCYIKNKNHKKPILFTNYGKVLMHSRYFVRIMYLAVFGVCFTIWFDSCRQCHRTTDMHMYIRHKTSPHNCLRMFYQHPAKISQQIHGYYYISTHVQHHKHTHRHLEKNRFKQSSSVSPFVCPHTKHTEQRSWSTPLLNSHVNVYISSWMHGILQIDNKQ